MVALVYAERSINGEWIEGEWIEAEFKKCGFEIQHCTSNIEFQNIVFHRGPTPDIIVIMLASHHITWTNVDMVRDVFDTAPIVVIPELDSDYTIDYERSRDCRAHCLPLPVGSGDLEHTIELILVLAKLRAKEEADDWSRAIV